MARSGLRVATSRIPGGHAPNTRLQWTRSAPLHSPLSFKMLGGLTMKEGRTVGLRGTAVGSSSASATIGASHAGTGRSIVADGDYELAWRWAELKSREEMTVHAGHERFVQSLAELRRHTEEIECVRGRLLPPSPAPKWDVMGPPPENSNPRAARYNGDGCCVLYLSDSCDGVARERRGDVNDVWIQNFRIPAGELRIADVSGHAVESFLNRAFWWAELAGEEGSRASIEFSQLIAEIMSREFDGMVVPGVRGAHGRLYRNIVMFRPHPAWRSWVCKEEDPMLLKTCLEQPADRLRNRRGTWFTQQGSQ